MPPSSDHTFVSTRISESSQPEMGHKGEIEHVVSKARSARETDRHFPQAAAHLLANDALKDAPANTMKRFSKNATTRR